MTDALDGTESTADHGVLAHDDDTLATESDTDLVHLVGTDVVDIDDEDGGWWESHFLQIRGGGCTDSRYLATSSLSFWKYSSFCARVAPIVMMYTCGCVNKSVLTHQNHSWSTYFSFGKWW